MAHMYHLVLLLSKPYRLSHTSFALSFSTIVKGKKNELHEISYYAAAKGVYMENVKFAKLTVGNGKFPIFSLQREATTKGLQNR